MCLHRAGVTQRLFHTDTLTQRTLTQKVFAEESQESRTWIWLLPCGNHAFHGVTVWWYDGMTVWQYDSVTVWQYDSMTKWQYAPIAVAAATTISLHSNSNPAEQILQQTPPTSWTIWFEIFAWLIENSDIPNAFVHSNFPLSQNMFELSIRNNGFISCVCLTPRLTYLFPETAPNTRVDDEYPSPKAKPPFAHAVRKAREKMRQGRAAKTTTKAGS